MTFLGWQPGLSRLVATAGIVVQSVLGAPHAERITVSAPTANPGISLISQTPYVVKQGNFDVQVSVQDGGQTGDFVQVLTFANLITRTAFDQALQGKYQSTAIYQPTVAVSKLPADPSGGFDIDVPVNPFGASSSSSASTLPTFEPAGESAVYPVQIGLFNHANQPVGAPIDTFMVYALGPQKVTGYQPLDVGVVLPVTASPNIGPGDQIEPVTPDDSSRLSNLVSALGSSGRVPTSLQITPQVLDALASGSTTDQQTLARLERLVASGDEVFPATYVRRSIDDFEDSGLDGELNAQIQAGSTVFAADFGSAPPTSLWAVNGTVDTVSLAEMQALGASQLVLPSSDMTALTNELTVTTFGQSTQLSVPGLSNFSVFGADSGLTDDFERTSNPALDAYGLLAELAMIQLETPSVGRAVVAMPPEDFVPSAAFVSTLQSGLAGNPLIHAVPLSTLFHGFQSSIVRQITPSSLNSGTIDPSFANDARSIRQSRSEVTGLAYLLPGSQATYQALPDQLLVGESSDISAQQRQSILALIRGDATKVTSQIDLPGPTSITLTSAKSELPVTILSSPTLRASVELELSSDRLIFDKYNPPQGSCELQGPTEEVCRIKLVTQNTTLRIPVESRSPGVFPLYVTMSSPDGSLVITSWKDTVRSTAISNVGIVLIIVALLSLAIWWVRDLRHARRARRLVPAPADELVLTADPVIDRFFAEPAAEPADRPPDSV